MNIIDYKDIVYKIIGAAMNVHAELKWGLLESVYSEALQIELKDLGLKCETEVLLPCYYKNRLMKKYFKLDLVVEDVIVKLKATQELTSVYRSQLMNYLRLTKKTIGLLINFGSSSLQSERYAFIENTNECVLLDKNMNPAFQ